MKLTVVGGGSTYTPELIDGIAGRRASLDVDEIVLVDPDADRLAVVGPFSQRLLDHAGRPARVRTTSVLEEGVEGASAVLLQLRVGGQLARSDETFPLVCDCVGQETTGPGGLAKALLTVPVVLDIADRVREIAGEDTWIVNFTNPVGLCNVAITFQRWTSALLGLQPDDVKLEHVGLNHLTWERGLIVDGENVLPKLIAEHSDELAEHIGIPGALIRRLGVVPSYYLKYFSEHDEVVAKQKHERPRADVVTEVENELLKIYQDPAVVTKPEALSQRGGACYSEAAVQLVHSLTSGAAGEEHVVNVRNNGTLPFLPDDAVIEVPAIVDSRGASPLPVKPVEPGFAGLISHVTGVRVPGAGGGRPRRPRPGRRRTARPPVDRPVLDRREARRRTGRGEQGPIAVGQGVKAAVLAIDGGNSKTVLPLHWWVFPISGPSVCRCRSSWSW